MTSRQSTTALIRVHLWDKTGLHCWERRENLVKIAKIKSNGLKMRQLASINACVTLSHDWPVYGNTLALITQLKTYDPWTLWTPRGTHQLLAPKKMQCHCCDRGIHSSSQETSLLADRLIHCLPVCVGDKAAPVPSQGLHWAQNCMAVCYVTSLLLESRACQSKSSGL